MSKSTQYVTLSYNGTAYPGMVSEPVYITVDGSTSYRSSFVVQLSKAWSTGVQVNLTFYDASNTQVGSATYANSGAITANTQYTVSSTAVVPGATAKYCVARCEITGTPATDNIMTVYSGRVENTNNPAVPAVLNQNYAFLQGTDPWQAENAAIMQWVYAPLTSADGNVYDSLVIDDSIELMGGPGGVQSLMADLTDQASGIGAIYRIAAAGGEIALSSTSMQGYYDLGAPQPTSDVVESLLLDGENPHGRRASNRTISLPVVIFAKSLRTMAAAREYLLRSIDKEEFKITWTPASTGLPMVLDCFRAAPSVVTYGFNRNREAGHGVDWAISVVTLSIPALPYGKSGIDGIQSLTFQNGLVDGNPYYQGALVDDFSTVNSMLPYTDQGDTYQTGGWRANPTQNPDGSTANSAEYIPPSPPGTPWPRAVYKKTGLSVNGAHMTKMTMWLGQSYDTQWAKDPKFVSNVRMTWTIWDNNGKTLTFDGPAGQKIPWGADPNKPVWTKVSASIPQNHDIFNYADITAYQVVIANWNSSTGATGTSTAGHDSYMKMKAWMYHVDIEPSTIQDATTARGSVYTLKGVSGMARSPINTEVQLPAGVPSTVEITKSGTWLVPADVYTVTAENWGGGGAGASVNTNMAGGGGGGAEYAKETGIAVIPGTQVPVTIGAGGTAADLVGSEILFTAAGAHTWTCPAGVTTPSIEVWGGGAAGAGGGGGGGGGKYEKVTLTSTPGQTYFLNVGNGGAPNTGTSSAQNLARNGGTSWFNSVNRVPTSADTGMPVGQGGQSPNTGSAAGGFGGNGSSPAVSPVRSAGGYGGTSPGQAGGGGAASGSHDIARGAPGGNSPGNGPLGKYKNGGPGGIAVGRAGNGGAGANVPGTPVAGSQPGGGGGGGYTGSTGGIYLGARGGDGMVRITYQVAVGNPVNGGATTFGASGTTNLTVTANGGTSASTNSPSGSTGGSGSSNSVHFGGGAGGGGTAGTGGSDLNELIFGYGTQVFTNLVNATLSGTAMTFTSGASAAAAAAGNMGVVFLLMSSANDATGINVTDSAGNSYLLAGSAPTVLTGKSLYIFTTQVITPVTTSTTLTVNGFAVNETAPAVWWMTSPYLSSVLPYVTPANGSGTSATVSFTNPVPGAPVYEAMLDLNAANAAYSGISVPWWSTTSNVNSWSDGASNKWNLSGIVTGGGAQAVNAAATLGTTGVWTRIAIPFQPRNADTIPVWLGQQATTTAATTTTVTTPTLPVDAGSGTIVVAVTAPAAGTPVVTDSASNTYTKQFTSSSSGGVTTIFTSQPTANIAQAGTWTVTDGTSQTRVARVVYLPGVTAYDASANTSATGSGTTAAVSELAPGAPNQYVLAIANNSVTGTYTTPSGWASAIQSNAAVSGAIQQGIFLKKQLGTTPLAFSATQSATGAWTASITAFQLTQGRTSGAGGSAAGPLGAGFPGIGATGGSGSTGGGNGAPGASGVNSPGNAAGLPGGGGSGGTSGDVTPGVGGAGGRGMVRLTWQPPLRAFNDLIVHRPGEDSGAKNLNPIVGIPPSDPPDNREYPVASLLAGANAQFGGTYTVYLISHAWDTATASRKIAVTVNQYEYKNGPVISSQATKTVTPSTDIINGYVSMGELALPIKDYDDDASEVYYTVSVHDTNGNDRFQDIVFLDTMGQTVLVNIAPGTAGDGRYHAYYIDEPSTGVDLGQILGTGFQRNRAISVFDMAFQTGGPLYIDDGLNSLLVYSTSGAPNLGVTYAPRWYIDRLS